MARIYKKQIIHALYALGLGLLTLLVSKVQFVIPGAEIGFTDLREVVVLISVIYLPSWSYMLIVSFVGSLGTPPEGSLFTTIAMHVVAGPVAWIMYNWIKTRIKRFFNQGLLWAIMVIVYYLLLAVPVLMICYLFLGLMEPTSLFYKYLNISFGLRYEISITLTITTLYFVMSRLSSMNQENVNWLNLISRGVNMGFWNWDLKNDKLTYNNNYAAMLGYTVKEISDIDNFWENHLHPDDKENAFNHLNRHLQGKTDHYETEYRLRTKSGDFIWVHDVGKVIEYDDEGKALLFSGIHLNTTDIKENQTRLESEIIKVKKLESLGVLAGGIAHDFNNLLSGFFGNISLAKMKLDSTHPAYNFIDEAEGAIDRATGLTKQLLSFAKGGAPVRESANLINIVKESADFVLHGTGFSLDFKADDDLRTVSVDKGQISQVVTNLVINAKEAMVKGGQISIYLQNAIISNHENLKDGNYIKVTLKDQGFGISRENLDKIFDPYFSTKESGHGLGLASVFAIIKRHGGLIEVDSVPGEGTKFTFYIPASTSNKKIVSNKILNSGEEGKYSARILFMDDDPHIVNFIKPLMKELGHEVVFSKNGEEAIDRLKKDLAKGQTFDIAVLDLTIRGGMGGKDAMREICKLDSSIKSIVSSGYSEDPVLSEYEKYGFNGVITKPFRSKELKAAIERVMNRTL